jgi:hypothetical protein
MNDKLDGELESPENWDYENIQTKEPVKAPRVIVSVAFKRKDFTIVSEYAKHLGKKTSEFIRDTALDQANGRSSYTQINAFGSTGLLWVESSFPPITKTLTIELTSRIDDTVLTSC